VPDVGARGKREDLRKARAHLIEGLRGVRDAGAFEDRFGLGLARNRDARDNGGPRPSVPI